MDESGFRAWLDNRGVDNETVEALVADANKIRDLYAGAAEVGAALDHEAWLEDLTNSVRGSNHHQVTWVALGMAAALIAFIEMVEE